VNSDLMKEMFAEYRQSKEHRNRYNLPVHNAAAVLASAQFRLTVSDDSAPERLNALFLTGVPGAGKTTSVMANRNEFPPEARIVYEGQLADATHAIPKIEAALVHGLVVKILAIHVRSEQSLTNTISRYEREGRGATIEALARIQGNLPAGLKQIHAHFGRSVGLAVVDKRDIIRSVRFAGWDALSLLESEGDYDYIKRNLTRILEERYARGIITQGAYDQALGRATTSLP
jgi:hypothetical protein